MTKKNIYILITCLCSCFHLGASIDSTFALGNKLYQEGKYVEAIQNYNSLLDENYSSYELLHNLGVAYLQEGEIGKSVLFLERALRMTPANKAIKNSLEAARSQVNTEIIEIPDFVLKRIWDSFAGVINPGIWIIVQILLLVILMYFLYKWRLSDSKFQGFVGSIVSGTLLFLFILAGFTSSFQTNDKSSAVVLEAVDMKTGADSRSDILQNLSPGVKVKIIDRVDDWLRVELLNKEIGWINEKSIEVI